MDSHAIYLVKEIPAEGTYAHFSDFNLIFPFLIIKMHSKAPNLGNSVFFHRKSSNGKILLMNCPAIGQLQLSSFDFMSNIPMSSNTLIARRILSCLGEEFQKNSCVLFKMCLAMCCNRVTLLFRDQRKFLRAIEMFELKRVFTPKEFL